jgi:hypothetical protein
MESDNQVTRNRTLEYKDKKVGCIEIINLPGEVLTT